MSENGRSRAPGKRRDGRVFAILYNLRSKEPAAGPQTFSGCMGIRLLALDPPGPSGYLPRRLSCHSHRSRCLPPPSWTPRHRVGSGGKTTWSCGRWGRVGPIGERRVPVIERRSIADRPGKAVRSESRVVPWEEPCESTTSPDSARVTACGLASSSRSRSRRRSPPRSAVSAGPGVESPADPIDLSAQRIQYWDGPGERWAVLSGEAAVLQGAEGLRPLRRRPDRRDLASRHQGLSGSCLRRGGRPDHGATAAPRELASRGAHDPEGRPVVRLPEEWQRAAAGTARRTEDPRAVRPQAGRAGGRPPSAEVTSPAIAAGAASPPLPELEPVPERPPARRDPDLKPARFVRQDPPQAREPAPEVDPPVAAPAPVRPTGRPGSTCRRSRARRMSWSRT